jgi:hypothetical protein
VVPSFPTEGKLGQPQLEWWQQSWASPRSEFLEPVVDLAIRLKIPAIWMQEGVIHEKAAEKARAAGAFVVMDRCILVEHRARFR